MDDEEGIRRMIKERVKATSEELSDLLKDMPLDVEEERVLNVYYRRNLGDGAKLIVQDTYFVDKDLYVIRKIIQDRHGNTRTVAHKRTEDMVEAMKYVKDYLKDAGPTKLDG